MSSATPNPAASPAAPRGSVLVVGPGSRGRGGIASVIRSHAQTETWLRRGLRHLSTFDDRSPLHKLWSAAAAYAAAPLLLWRARMVHIHLAAQTSILRKLPIVALARLLRRPVIVHVHAPSEASIFEHTPRWATNFLFASAARVVALSESWAAIFRAHHPRTLVVVIPNAIPHPPAPSRPSASPRIVLFAGKLDARKGYADLLAAAPAVLHEFPDVQFWFAGHGELQAAQSLAARLDIAPQVRLLGWLDAPALDTLYTQATAFVLPSYAEGVPMSVLEAMSHAVPVIATPVGGLPELIRDGENGIFVPPGDVPALARNIAGLLRHPAHAATLGAAGRATVQQLCSLETVSAQLEALYAGVAEEPGSPRPRSLPMPPGHPSSNRPTQGNQVTAHLRPILTLSLCAASLSLTAAQQSPDARPRHPHPHADFHLVGLHSPATVSGSIFVQASALPEGTAVRYLLDDQAVAAATAAPFPLGSAAEGYSLAGLPPGIHHLRAEATLPTGQTLRSADLTLDLVPSLNHRFSPALTPYANQPTAQSQTLRTVLRNTSTPGAALSHAERRVRKDVLAMYLNWGIDPSLDSANDQSAALLALHPTAWAGSRPDAETQPLSMRFSPDAPFYQAIPKHWPRIALPAGYLGNVQLNTVEEGDGIGFGQTVADARDPQLEVLSQWYGNTATRRVFPFRISPRWERKLPWQPGGDRHMIFVDPVDKTFIGSYKTSLDPSSGGVQALFASSPVKLETLGDHGGSVAAGFAELPAMLQPGEATDPHHPIPHALGGSVSRTWAARVYPASAWDGNLKTSVNSCTGQGFTNTGLIPYGGVLQLDPALDLSTLGLTLPAFRILQAIQTFGYYVEDFGCSGLDIYSAISEAELNPYGGLWGYNRRGPGVQNEVERVLLNNKLFVVAPLTKKQ